MLHTKKFHHSVFSSLACFTWMSSVCFSLPSEPEVKSGSAQVEYVNSHTMHIKASDNAILHYEDFQVGPGETVVFFQNPDSCVLHQVTGNKTSQISGSIHSLGNVVFVNSRGIVVDKSATVETGSLILSTLEAKESDLSQFTLMKKSDASLVNEGSLRSQEGSIVLLAPHVCNLGSIEAKLGQVALGSGENVTFDGTTLLVEGSLHDAFIEQRGCIQASSVFLKLPVSAKAMVDGEKSYALFTEEQGTIKSFSGSKILADSISIEGASLVIQGLLDTKNILATGGDVHLFGREISLQGAKIDASGLLGGGKVLVGGEFQGKGNTPYASKVLMDESSEICVNALDKGDGGLVVLWSEDQTVFAGKILAQGGLTEGNGGLVETSSIRGLNVDKGEVNTAAPQGNTGEWLLDPTYMWIENGDTFAYGYGDCTYTGVDGNGHVSVNKFLNLKSNVTVQAAWGIYLQNSVTVTGSSECPKPSLTLKTCSDVSFLQIGYGSDNEVAVTTSGGDFTLNTPMKIIYLRSLSLKVNTSGGNVNLQNLQPYNSSNAKVTIDAGTGIVSLNAVSYEGARLGNITINSAGYVVASSIDINGELNMTSAPLKVSGTSSVKTNGHNMYLKSIDTDPSGSSSLAVSLSAGSSNTISIGTVGSSASPISSLTIGSGSASSVTFSNITTTGDINIMPPVTTTGSLTSQSGSIILGGSFTMGGNCTLSAGKGISITSQITSSSGSNSYDLTFSVPTSSTGKNAISLTGDVTNVHNFTITSADTASFYNITTTGGNVSIACPSTIRGSGTISSSGGSVTFSNGVLPDQAGRDLVINSTAAAINMQGMGNATYPFGKITLTGGGITLGQSISTTGDLILNNSGALAFSASEVVLGGSCTQSGGSSISLATSIAAQKSISFASGVTLTGNTFLQAVQGIHVSGAITPSIANLNLTLDAGNNPLTVGALGSNYPLGNLSIIASNLTLTGDITASSVAISAPITLSSSHTNIVGTSGISLSNALTGTSASLTLNAGNASLRASGLGSKSNPLEKLSITASDLNLTGDIITNGSISFAGPITVGSTSTLQGSDISLGGVIFPSTGSSFDLTLASSSGAIGVSGLGNSSAPFKNINIQNQGEFSAVSGSINTSGNFIQSGSGAVSLAASIATPGSITFAGAVTVTGSLALQASQGISLSSTISPNSGKPDLTFDAGSHPLMVAFLSSASSCFGKMSIVASNLALQGDLYADSSIEIDPAITISANTVLNSLSGNEGIVLLGPVTTSGGTPTLTLQASSGPLNLQSLGSSTAPLGAISLTGSYITLNGDITSASSMTLTGSITTTQSLTLQGDQGITLHQDLVPSTASFDLMLQAVGGTILVQNLGTDANPLKNISLLSAGSITPKNMISSGNISLSGTTITLGSKVTASGDITISNTDLLTIPAGSISFSGNFSQTGSGNVSLGTNMTTSGSIAFQGPVTVTGSTTLQGSKGIVITSSLAPSSGAPALTLDAGSNSLVVQFNSSESNPFGSVSLSGSSLSLDGNIYITGATTFMGPQGITMNGSLSPSSGTPNLTLDAGSSAIKGTFGGSESNPFGALYITASNLTLQGNVYSNTSITIDPPITISSDTIFNSLSGYGGVLLLGPVTASQGNPSLTVLAAKGPADVDRLGSNDVPLGDVSITGGTYIHLGGDVVSMASLVLTGSVNITDSRNLVGADGITLHNDLTPSTTGFNLTLQTCGSDISTQSLGKSGYALQTLALTCSTFDLGGSITAGTVIFNGETCSSSNWSSGTYSSCPVTSP